VVFCVGQEFQYTVGRDKLLIIDATPPFFCQSSYVDTMGNVSVCDCTLVVCKSGTLQPILDCAALEDLGPVIDFCEPAVIDSFQSRGRQVPRYPGQLPP
jgi:hypothetical protein